jgi:hypothetical protein
VERTRPLKEYDSRSEKVAQPDTSNSDDDLSLFSPRLSSKVSVGSISRSSGSSYSSDYGSLTLDEIEDHVKATMPNDIKNKIPEDAWRRIFGASQAGKTRKPIGVVIEEEGSEKGDEDIKGDEDEDQDDDTSAIFEITGYTAFVDEAKTSETTNKVLARIKPDKEEVSSKGNDNKGALVCPTLPPRDSESIIAGGRSKIKDAAGWGSSEDYNIVPSRSPARETTSAQSTKEEKPASGVDFGTVQVRYYEGLLDVNPAVSSGVTISIGWNYRRGGTISVDDWEVQRSGSRRSRPNDFILPKKHREKVLKDLGYKQKDIATATRIILKAKQNRKLTVQNLPNQHIELAVETAARKVKGLLSLGRKKGLVSNASYY